MMDDKPLYYKYWGKARKKEDGSGYDYHLLPYHCLDVAAVGRMWLENDKPLRSRIAYSIGIDNDGKRLYEIICFFLTLHDLGKFDIRFQSKVPELRDLIWTDLDLEDLLLSAAETAEFDHGKAGYDLFVKFYPQLLELNERDEEILDKWRPWIGAVCGHHGVIPKNAEWRNPNAEDEIIEHDRLARKAWFASILNLFGVSTSGIPILQELNQGFLAGFCSVADWIASNDIFVRWCKDEMPVHRYFEEALEHCKKTDILKRIGITGYRTSKFSGVKALLGPRDEPRQVQTLVDKIPTEPSLTIIESTTGSGKTEAALAYAWKLIDSGLADAIVFALPTQATADAMLERLQKFAPILFEGGDSNLVLAHGKAKYNETFANLKAASKPGAAQKGDQCSVQCAEWISCSRKRVFLGQIGVCTIDQVLLSVLPVRHNFVRSFGVGKSVLIIDEVHAYDRYMYGLLVEVLKRQKAAGGCAVLLSATLPAIQKQELFDAWQEDGHAAAIDVNAAYPLISRLAASGKPIEATVDKSEMPPEREVGIELTVSQDMEPDNSTIAKLIEAARRGATVAIVCNIVQSAQRIARHLRGVCAVPVDVFHARYRFKDRKSKEAAAKDSYGKKAPRETGRILVATQVVEQSLDLDFDWLVTQLCPVDLLFQRMGRLHRHERNRPPGFENPFCTILSNDTNDFGAHEMIYGDARIFWRTREMLKGCNKIIHFPGAYRKWIEEVYGREEWNGELEPDSVIGRSCAFREMQKQMWYEAQQRATNGMNPFADTDQNASSLTRGKEMGLNLVPVIAGQIERILLDGECRKDVNQFEWDELLNMNSMPVPASWKQWLPRFEDGYIFLPMVGESDGWIWRNGKYSLKYTTDYGLERLEETK
jgi:CRISPR-associated endonuclease/helicase Cas3